MCGITGIYAFNEIGRFSMINLHLANEALAHRGPDAARLFDANRTGLGHRRLSIIDLSSDGNQPMSDASGRFTIVFNGEIYNYKTLREDLKAKGIVFHSASDTEVLLYAYIHYQEKCLDKLHGFFAFAVYDKEEDSIFIARDRLGIKPLWYYLDEDKFLFASEPNAILAYRIPQIIDRTSIFQYFQLHYVPAPYTIFKNMYKLLQGHYLTLKGKDLQIKRYYSPPTAPLPEYKNLSYEAAQKKLVQLLEESVLERLIADVPVGAFLSGGVDSSAIVALASRHTKYLNTFSVGYADEPFFDETKYARLVAEKFGTNHTVFRLTNDDLFEAIFNLLDFFGEPFADSSAIPVFVLSQRTKKKITVALSGDGGDELFAGYNKYLGEYKAREGGFLANILKNSLPLLEKLPRSRGGYFPNKFRQLHRFAESMQKSPQERYWYLSSFIEENELWKMFSENLTAHQEFSGSISEFLTYQNRKKEFLQYIENKNFNEVLYADVQTLLPNDMLHKVDSMSMAHALEVRVPFLAHQLVNFAFSLPASYKIDGNRKKRIVQDAFKDILPKELYHRPKHGFDVPLAKGFKTVLKSWINQLLDEDFIVEQKVFNPEYIKQLKKTIFESSNFDQNHIWAVLVFQHWWKRLRLDIEAKEED
ncbi:asparagine synthase (glutamine-hydrolyzing) [Thermoflexibacter ruber]|uniref:asparagine synthase (glutamine-hydrolyzing) n=1 Tax=Thermoflexibacter ruber TaxID=1003 RepID=A0A1I2I1V8_9BACT|nr:asparagine synthase (glutamine-hydrolyzing) [Thermoflexibacter ruber]SFF36379.1 asparagine synthase (glutamine-hydrolysing) [Thermoflexibacter ruber]